MTAELRRVVVVGAATAGLSAIEALRRDGYEHDIVAIGQEPALPYDRPPLSKHLLQHGWRPGSVYLRSDHDIAGLGAEWTLGRRAVGLQTRRRVVLLDNGDQVPYDGLVIATGLQVNRLPEPQENPSVHYLRTIDDAVGIRKELLQARSVTIVGNGVLGTELASAAHAHGLEVTVVGIEPPMVAQLGSSVAAVLKDTIIEHGVRLLEVPEVALVSVDGRTQVTAGTELIASDVVVVAIGGRPQIDWLNGSGLSLDNGLVCDSSCIAGPGIVAAGDVANWLHEGYGRHIRLEQRLHAADQGSHAARTLLGDPQPYRPVPFSWTNQFSSRIQWLGLVEPAARFVLRTGSFAGRAFAGVYVAGGRVTGALAWNAPRELMALRPLVQEGAPWE